MHITTIGVLYMHRHSQHSKINAKVTILKIAIVINIDQRHRSISTVESSTTIDLTIFYSQEMRMIIIIQLH